MGTRRDRVSPESTFSFKAGVVFLAAWLAGGLLWGASSNYVALFSAEQQSYRRILIDGVGNRRVEVELDNLGQVEVKVWGVGERAYVGRRVYESGYFIPVTIQVDFPRKNLMSIKVSGTRFRDYVRYKIVDSDIYVIDLYIRALPRESYFREETISALWPGGAIPAGHNPGSSAIRAGPSREVSTVNGSPDAGKGNGPLPEDCPAGGGLGRVCFRVAAGHRPGPGVVHSAEEVHDDEVCPLTTSTRGGGKPTHYLRRPGAGGYGA